MAKQRTQQEMSPAEIRVFGQYCLDNGIITETTEGQNQIIKLADYIINDWGVEVTPDTIDVAVKAFADAKQPIAFLLTDQDPLPPNRE